MPNWYFKKYSLNISQLGSLAFQGQGQGRSKFWFMCQMSQLSMSLLPSSMLVWGLSGPCSPSVRPPKRHAEWNDDGKMGFCTTRALLTILLYWDFIIDQIYVNRIIASLVIWTIVVSFLDTWSIAYLVIFGWTKPWMFQPICSLPSYFEPQHFWSEHWKNEAEWIWSVPGANSRHGKFWTEWMSKSLPTARFKMPARLKQRVPSAG